MVRLGTARHGKDSLLLLTGHGLAGRGLVRHVEAVQGAARRGYFVCFTRRGLVWPGEAWRGAAAQGYFVDFRK